MEWCLVLLQSILLYVCIKAEASTVLIIAVLINLIINFTTALGRWEGGTPMRKINLTRKQKILIASHGLKPENWYLENETEDYLCLISKNGQRRLIKKGKR